MEGIALKTREDSFPPEVKQTHTTNILQTSPFSSSTLSRDTGKSVVTSRWTGGLLNDRL